MPLISNEDELAMYIDVCSAVSRAVANDDYAAASEWDTLADSFRPTKH